MGARETGGEVKALMICTVPMVEGDGILTVMLNYAEHMDRDGVVLDFLAINDPAPAIRERIAAMGGRLHVVEGRIRRPLSYIRAVAGIVRENGYDVVHAHGNSRTLAAEMVAARLGGARARCPHSHNTRGSYPALHRLLKPLFDYSYTHGFACSVPAGRWLFGNRPFTVLNNGLDTQRYRFDASARAEWREKLGIGNRAAVGHVGRFCEQKNHRFLIDAFERALRLDPDRVLVLAGDGPLRPDVEAAVREKGMSGSVIFLGVVRDMPQLLSAMDLMALPSLFEGLPNVLLEWQAAGLPICASDAVDPAANLAGTIDFLPLDLDRWAKVLAAAVPCPDRDAESRSGIEAIARGGYDIRKNAAGLRALYLECAKPDGR